MLRKAQLLSLVVILLVSLIVGSTNVAYAQSAEADVFAVIKVKDPDGFIANIGKLVDSVEPGMGAMASGMILGQMQMILKNPEWIGMDKAGEYTVVVLNPMMYPQPLALVVPVTGKDEYLNVLSQSLTGGEEVDGIYTFMQPTQMEMFVAFTENAGILAEDTSVAGQIKALVEGKSPVLTEVPAVKGQLTVSLPLNKILATMRPMIDGFKQMMLPGMGPEMPQEGAAQPEGTQPEGAPSQPPEIVKNMLLTEIDIALSLMEQIEKLHLGIDVQPEEGMRISKAVFAAEGSNIEKFMAAQSPQKSSLLGIIPSDSAIIASSSINMTPKFKDWYIWVTKVISSGMTPEEDTAIVDKMAQWTTDALEIFGGDVAFGALSQAEDSLVTEVFTLKDAPKATQLVEQYPEMFNSMTGMYKSLGLDLDVTLAGKEEYKGGEILNFDLGFNAENIPDPEGQEMFNKIFGEKLSMPFGVVGNYGVVGFGKNAHGQVQQIMELLDSGADVAAEYTPTMFGLPEENNFFMYLSIPKVLLWAAKYAPEAPPDFQIQESPGVGMTGRFVDAHLEGELFVPIAEILAIRNIAPQVAGKVPEEPLPENQ
jgi:hypothetical protein